MSASKLETRIKTRWIVIGFVRSNWFVIMRNCGFPGGFYLHWKGRMNPFQPDEFLSWEQVLWAVRRRLGMARLEMVGVEKESAGYWEKLRVEVRREKEPRMDTNKHE